MESNAHALDDAEKIWDSIEAMRTCMMVTVDNGVIRARPMGALVEKHEKLIYFFTHRRTHKDDELREDQRCCLTFSNSNDNVYVSLTGTVSECTDETVKKRLWSLPLKAELPEGPEDRDVLLLVFQPHSGEYWNGPSSKIVTAVKMAFAVVKGEQADLGENRKVHF